MRWREAAVLVLASAVHAGCRASPETVPATSSDAGTEDASAGADASAPSNGEAAPARSAQSRLYRRGPSWEATPEGRCALAALRQRNGPGDACLASCFAQGEPRIGGGCFHVCFAYKEDLDIRQWREPDRSAACPSSSW